MSEHPLYQHHRERFGTVHPTLGRSLAGSQKTAAVGEQGADERPLSSQPIAPGPISHEEQEKRLADSKMWVPHASFEPAKVAVQGASAYAGKIHLPDPHQHDYSKIRTSTANLREIGRAYDRLPTRDPSAIPHFERMAKEIRDQHDHMTHAMGIKTEVVHDDPYPDVHHMVHDVVHNKRLKVLSTKVTGGHDFLDDETNDKFRAVHDLFGHAATGRGFDAHGEEAAWAAHSRMFTPHARGAMSSETRGQNSALHINGQFQAQKTAILPSHMWDDSAMAKHTSLMTVEAFFRKVAHDSGDGETIYHCPFCGSGQVIARSDRTIECQFCHTCFTVQVQPEFPAFPQTIDGVPVQVPGMPGQVGVDPAGAGGPAEEPLPPEEGEEDPDNPIFAQSALRTRDGASLSPEDYIARLALRHSPDRIATLSRVRRMYEARSGR